MKKLWLIIMLLAFVVMLYAPAVVAAPPGSDSGMSQTDSDDPDDGINPPEDPPDTDPWSPGGKMIAPTSNEDNVQTRFWIVVEIWSIKLIWVH